MGQFAYALAFTVKGDNYTITLTPPNIRVNMQNAYVPVVMMAWPICSRWTLFDTFGINSV